MSRQGNTGKETERIVRERLEGLGLDAKHPQKDNGVDFEVSSRENPQRIVRVQVKGRGSVQKNKRYRWFQLRTTKAQRKHAGDGGFDEADAYIDKVKKCDIFILVALKYEECWVFSSDQILEIIDHNKTVYGNRRDNILGHQKEMDLDISVGGKPLTELYQANCNNFSPIQKLFS